MTAESIALLGPYSACNHTQPPSIRGSRIKITVKGNLPLEADFKSYGLGDHLTLPDDWAKWAAVAAHLDGRPSPGARLRSATGTSTTTRF